MKELYPPIETYNEGYLDVGSGHQIYFEESGDKNGIPVIHIHGGPGSYSKPNHRQFYNPKKYRIICFDQRGCGKSKYTDLLKDNTTQDTINDIEKIRTHLGIDKWLVNGGSWGSFVAITYSIQHPEAILGLFLRAICLGEREDKFMFQDGANYVYPEEYSNLLKVLNANKENIFERMYEEVFQKDIEKAYIAAKEINDYQWELMNLVQQEIKEIALDDVSKNIEIKGVKIYLHYSKNKYFFSEKYIFENLYKLKEIPIKIIHGRYDMVCPYTSAWLLSKSLPNAVLDTTIAGHYHMDPENKEDILNSTDTFAIQQKF